MCINIKYNHYFDSEKMAKENMREVFGIYLLYLIFS